MDPVDGPDLGCPYLGEAWAQPPRSVILIMKCLVLVASTSRKAGGLFECVRRLCQVLKLEQGLEVEILGLEDENTSQDLGAWYPLRPRVVAVWGPRLFGYSPQLRRRLQEARADILHAHGLWMHPSLASLQWARQSRRPYIVSPQGMLDPWALRNSGWKKRIAAWLFENAHLQGAACLHALCRSEALSIRRYGLGNPICVIPNGVDLPQNGPTDPPPWRDRRGRDRKVMLYLGRLHPKKGLVNLLRAWASLHRGGLEGLAEWSLVVAGWDQGGHESALKTLAAKLNLQDHVVFIGPQFNEAKAATFCQADAFILPSFSEGLPVAILEAWAYGLPVLMTPQCNLPEGFEAGAAIAIDPEVESIAHGLEELFSMSDSERKGMGARGRALVQEKFYWPKIAAEMKAVYEWILGGGSPPSCVMTE